MASQLNYRGIKFPVEISQVGRVEKQNEIAINIFGYENKVLKLRSSNARYKEVMNLLLIERDGKSHYVLIKDFNRLMFNVTRSRNKKYFCMSCLQTFSKEEVLAKHEEDCIVIKGNQVISMPPQGSFVEFKNYGRRLQVPFVIYADFESLLPSVDEGGSERVRPYQEHIACGFSYKVVCSFDDKYSRPIQGGRGKDAVHDFLYSVMEEANRCTKIMNAIKKPLRMTPSDEAEQCHICGKAYDEDSLIVRDHCHITGRYRGSTHQSCNLNFKVTKKIPVVFHNLRGYDEHLIMPQIGRVCKERSWVDEKGKKHEMNVNVIPNGMEKYTAFTMGQRLVFIDSFQFMSSSLASLAQSLAPTDFKHLTHEFGERTELMKRKGVYPYEYMDSFERFEEDCLPAQSKFFSSLTGEGITDEEYDHAKEVWKAFRMRNIGDYHDHYMAADVLLLADVFASFRSNCLKNYGLDPCHYFSSPGMAWDAMLSMTGIKLELISDIDKYLFVEKGIRGGISLLARGTARRIAQWCPTLTKRNQRPLSHSWMLIIFTVGQCASLFRRGTLSESS